MRGDDLAEIVPEAILTRSCCRRCVAVGAASSGLLPPIPISKDDAYPKREMLRAELSHIMGDTRPVTPASS